MFWQKITWNPLENLEARNAKEEADKHYEEMWEKAPEQLAKWKNEIKSLYNQNTSWENLEIAKDFASTVKWLKESPENIKKALNETKGTFEYSNLWFEVISKSNWYIDELAEAFLDSKKNKIWNKTETKQGLSADSAEAIFWWDKPDPYWREWKKEEQAWNLVDSNWKWVTSSSWEQVKSWDTKESLTKWVDYKKQQKSEVDTAKDKILSSLNKWKKEDEQLTTQDLDKKIEENDEGQQKIKDLFFNKENISFYSWISKNNEAKEIWNIILWEWKNKNEESKKNIENLIDSVWKNFFTKTDKNNLSEMNSVERIESLDALNNAFIKTWADITNWKSFSADPNIEREIDQCKQKIWDRNINPLEKLSYLNTIKQRASDSQWSIAQKRTESIWSWEKEKAWNEKQNLNDYVKKVQDLIAKSNVPEKSNLSQTFQKWLEQGADESKLREIAEKVEKELTSKKTIEKPSEIIREINQSILENKK